MNKIKILIPLIILVSCNSYYFPLWLDTPNRIINSLKAYSPGIDYIENQEYSFITVQMGQLRATLVLNSIEDEVFTWVGRDNVSIQTYRGVVIRTFGLEHNFKIIDPINSVRDILSNKKQSLSCNFDNPRLYELELIAKDYSQEINNISFVLVAHDINWRSEVSVIYEKNTLPTDVIQSLHPFYKPAKINFYYKY
ncbi:YjbF family lipoprotein [Gammaproteobacteria bacterium]|nr:YjbF family lipoprotein [Gammaproteobacteria bacterium]